MFTLDSLNPFEKRQKVMQKNAIIDLTDMSNKLNILDVDYLLGKVPRRKYVTQRKKMKSSFVAKKKLYKSVRLIR